jgi:hypothetical protein
MSEPTEVAPESGTAPYSDWLLDPGSYVPQNVR